MTWRGSEENVLIARRSSKFLWRGSHRRPLRFHLDLRFP